MVRPPVPAAFVTPGQYKDQLQQQQKSTVTDRIVFRNTDALRLAMARKQAKMTACSKSAPHLYKTSSYNTPFRAMIEADEEITRLLQTLRTSGDDVSARPRPQENIARKRNRDFRKSQLCSSQTEPTKPSENLNLCPKRKSECLVPGEIKNATRSNIQQSKEEMKENNLVNETPSPCSTSRPIKSILLESVYSNSDISGITCTSDTPGIKRRRIGESRSGLSVQFVNPPTRHIIDRSNSGWYSNKAKERMAREAHSLCLLPPPRRPS